MAAYIFHGSPGSYKTSSAIWFELLPALRDGRIVITNIEGMFPKEDIEAALGEKFPESAEVWRLSTQKDRGRDLMRCYFHWAPIGAMLIIDEVQDVFPTERTFKPETYDYVPVTSYRELLPTHWYDTHMDLLDSIKPTELTSADIDDLEQEIFDDKGHIIYPSTLKESFMRHRKYNWDIVLCTPDITQVHSMIRGACELGFSHMSKDKIGSLIPYFKRRPRIRQHLPKESGAVARKQDIQYFRKVPKEVHLVYKSTATGAATKSGVGGSLLSSGPLKFALVTFLLCIGYLVYTLPQIFGSSEVSQALDTQADSVSRSQDSTDSKKGSNVSISSRSIKTTVANVTDLDLPVDAKRIYLTSTTGVYESGAYKSLQATFDIETDAGIYRLDSHTLQRLGIVTHYVDSCLVRLLYNEIDLSVFCRPSIDIPANTDASGRPVVEIF